MHQDKAELQAQRRAMEEQWQRPILDSHRPAQWAQRDAKGRVLSKGWELQGETRARAHPSPHATRAHHQGA